LRHQVRAQVDLREWQEVADRCDYATFFHTPAWAGIFARSFPGIRVATLRFGFEDGTVAFFPLLEQTRFLGAIRIFESTGAGCYGGWVSAGALGPEHVREMVAWLLQHRGNLVWRLNPFAPMPELDEQVPRRNDSTEVLSLQEFADENALLYNYRHSVRKQIRKGERAGFRLAESSAWEEWEEYYRIYQTLLEKWGKAATSVYPLEFFRQVHAVRGPKVKLWLTRDGERIVGGNLNFYQGPHCVEWHAAYDLDYLHSGVRDFAVHQIILDARARGCRIYDFNPSGGHDGTRRFKQTFGTHSLPTDVIERRRGLYGSPQLRDAARALRRLRSGAEAASETTATAADANKPQAEPAQTEGTAPEPAD